MARMPLKINQTSTRPREVTVVIHVDGREYTQVTKTVEEWAIPHVAFAVVVQVEDPDYEGAAQSAKDNGEKLPPGW